jgi:hypothetical protein
VCAGVTELVAVGGVVTEDLGVGTWVTEAVGVVAVGVDGDGDGEPGSAAGLVNRAVAPGVGVEHAASATARVAAATRARKETVIKRPFMARKC